MEEPATPATPSIGDESSLWGRSARKRLVAEGIAITKEVE